MNLEKQISFLEKWRYCRDCHREMTVRKTNSKELNLVCFWCVKVWPPLPAGIDTRLARKIIRGRGSLRRKKPTALPRMGSIQKIDPNASLLWFYRNGEFEIRDSPHGRTHYKISGARVRRFFRGRFNMQTRTLTIVHPLRAIPVESFSEVFAAAKAKWKVKTAHYFRGNQCIKLAIRKNQRDQVLFERPLTGRTCFKLHRHR